MNPKILKYWLLIMLIGLTISFAGTSASSGYDDLVKLVTSHSSEEVIIAYINASEFSYDLSPDEILHLKDLGAAPRVIVAAIQHKKPVNNPAVQESDTVPLRTYVMVRPGLRYRGWWWLNEERRRKNAENLANAFQVDLAGLSVGIITLNYERLFGRQHGLVMEGSYYSDWDSHGEKAELAYRWHWAKSMHSGFIGIFINGSRFYGETRDHIWDNEFSGNSIGYKKTDVTVGPNIGKRWIVMPGLSMVGRIGYGYTWSKIDWEANPSAPDQRTKDWLLLDSGTDLELSLGYAF